MVGRVYRPLATDSLAVVPSVPGMHFDHFLPERKATQ